MIGKLLDIAFLDNGIALTFFRIMRCGILFIDNGDGNIVHFYIRFLKLTAALQLGVKDAKTHLLL
tara:strand:+ start:425 stop:619 length:195 start_codon:yes stop_codon:yes gene_type:complete